MRPLTHISRLPRLNPFRDTVKSTISIRLRQSGFRTTRLASSENPLYFILLAVAFI